MILFTDIITPRLEFVSDFIGNELAGKPIILTTDVEEFGRYPGPRIFYSLQPPLEGSFHIRPVNLLFEKGIHPQTITCREAFGHPCFFETSGDHPFDIFAAVFFLISRYEEYLPHQKDSYGRFAHEESLAFREGFLDQPLVNLWLNEFREQLRKRWSNYEFIRHPFRFFPTYDIDIAWSYRGKGLVRTAAAMLRHAGKGNWNELTNRMRVMAGKGKDPFDSYDWLHCLHREYRLKAHYFFHVGVQQGRYDKNISPRDKNFRHLLRSHYQQYPVGIHPSWKSGDQPELLEKEMDMMEEIIGVRPLTSRQHYIRFRLPETFRNLVQAGIKYDYSMGYGSINGFRASTSSNYYWYDMEKEEKTGLMLFPFCFMDANSYYEQKQDSTQTFTEMQHYYDVTRKAGGNLVMIWHNQFLGEDPEFRGWKEVYQRFTRQFQA